MPASYHFLPVITTFIIHLNAKVMFKYDSENTSKTLVSTDKTQCNWTFKLEHVKCNISTTADNMAFKLDISWVTFNCNTTHQQDNFS